MTLPALSDFLASALRDLPVGVWIGKPPNGEIAYANRALVESLGAPPAVSVTRDPAAYVVKDRTGRRYERVELPFFRALAARTLVVDDLVVEHEDGRVLNLRAFAHPVLDERGDVTHVIVTFVDIS